MTTLSSRSGKMKAACLLALCSLFLFLQSFSDQQPPSGQLQKCYSKALDTLREQLMAFRQHIADGDTALWLADLKRCRLVYKKAEVFIVSYYPQIAKRLNGPALMEAEAVNPNESVMPTGFQVLEADLFAEDKEHRKTALLRQAAICLQYVALLQQQAAALPIDLPGLYDAARLELYTLASLGLSGYDTPLLLSAIEEADASLEGIATALAAGGACGDSLQMRLERCRTYLSSEQQPFDQFDRGLFLSRYWRPLLLQLQRQQKARGVPFIRGRRAVKPAAASFLERDAFDPYFFAPDSVAPGNAALVALGKTLFSEPALSAAGRSCASCHQPGHGYADAALRNLSLQRDELLPRNTPTILNAALQPVLFADARVRYLEQQAHDVLQNEAEMANRPQQALIKLKASVRYKTLFAKAFPGKQQPMTQANIIAALAAFERSLVRLNAPFDRFLRGDETAMTQEQQQGFNLFMGKARCGSCHFMPLFNGAVPPFYERQDTEVIGVPSAAGAALPDTDLGVYSLFGFAPKKGAFKTPTVRNAALTAPYMHNGIYPDLASVIDFYDKGGGAGIGMDLPQQTLPATPLHLAAQEKKALIAFMHALSDQ